jgi:hypothetical protein
MRSAKVALALRYLKNLAIALALISASATCAQSKYESTIKFCKDLEVLWQPQNTCILYFPALLCLRDLASWGQSVHNPGLPVLLFAPPNGLFLVATC